MEITDEQYIRKAHELFHKDGEVEVDLPEETLSLPTSRVSESDGGAYVLAWVWVSAVEFEEEEEN